MSDVVALNDEQSCRIRHQASVFSIRMNRRNGQSAIGDGSMIDLDGHREVLPAQIDCYNISGLVQHLNASV
jgi:hypothetical protein